MTKGDTFARTKAASDALAALSVEAWDEAREQARLPDPFVWSSLTTVQLQVFGVACRIRLAEAGVMP